MKKNLLMLLILIFFISCSTENKEHPDVPGNDDKITVLSVNPQSFISQISSETRESSGLLLYDNLLWTFNDSGGENKLYALNTSGEIERTVTLKNAANVDWEDIAQDKENIYVGDFGNNNGNRKNLGIYKIKKSSVEKCDTVTATEIQFSYAEQEEFDYRPLNTPFDCEAITDYKGTLNIFTKNWVDETTSVYQIPKNEGYYKVSLTDTFNVNGLVTGADVSPDKKTLAMVGYKDFRPIVWLFSGFSDNRFFDGKETYIKLDDIFSAQTEGICFMGNDTLLISCEATTTHIQQVFLIDLNNIDI